ncbi:MAG TPA: glycine zipper 2TM domain-containing protein, partial [Burkholderiaceae bacterium]|nr:glycine zipper 2TM domain-containing protein [Burkholderiaceae bacterium]
PQPPAPIARAPREPAPAHGGAPYGAPAPMPGAGPYADPARVPVAVAARDWATVESVRTVRTGGEARSPGVGAIAGTVLGGVLGHQVGGGDGRKVGAVVGAIGGGVLGHQIEQRVRSTVKHEATVRLDDGGTRTFVRDVPWDLQAGDRVRVVGGTLSNGPARSESPARAESPVREVGYSYGG